MTFMMQREQASTRPYNILSLDGGGTWAIIQAMSLEDLYGSNTPGHTILKNFDLVVANSGGSLVAAGLWANMTPAQLITEFKSELIRKQIFSKLPLFKTWARAILKVGPKYFADAKLQAIRTLINKYDSGLGDEPIARLPLPRSQADPDVTDLILLAYDYDTNRAKFLRTGTYSAAGSQLDNIPYKTTLAEAVHASTNAPINYFNAPATISYSKTPIRAWDGAIAGYNNPILAGITEALANRVDRKSIQVLSIGTASRVLPLTGGEFQAAYEWMEARPSKKGFWILGDLRKLSMSIIENPPDVATYTAFFMIDDQLDWMGTPIDDPRRSKTKIVRLNPLMQPVVVPGRELFDVPSGHSNRPDKLTPGGFRYLMELDMDAVEEADVDLICLFGRLWIDEWVHNQPILAGPTRVECELGQRWYSQGRDQARALGLVPPPSADKLKEEKRKLSEKNELEEKLRASQREKGVRAFAAA